MGVEKINRGEYVGGTITASGRVTAPSYRVATAGITTKTSTQAGSTLSGEGASFITASATAGSNIFHLPHPTVGVLKTLVVAVGTTDAVDVLNSVSTAETFFGCTGNALRFSTGANKLNGALLVGKSTTQWAIVSAGAGVTVVGSSGV